MIINTFDNKSEAIINPKRKDTAIKVDVCIITFSNIIEQYVLDNYNCEKIAEYKFVTGTTPIYGFEYNNHKFAFFRTYVGGPAVSLEDYYTAEYTADGYSFAGYTLTGNVLANNLEEKDLITEYTLNSDDLVDQELYIYAAWARAGYVVTFKMNAPYKNGVQADSQEYSVEYLHNSIIDFADAELQSRISALEDTYFVFKNFSYAENGEDITSVVVDRYLTIYVNFDYTFTVVYNLDHATYKNDSVPRLPEVGTVRGKVGSTAVEYSANDNLLLEGFSSLYWSVDEATKVNFFDANGVHTFTTDDLDYANNNYEINLFVVGDTAKYTVNLHYFRNLADLEASYNKMQTMDTIDYTQLNYSVMTVNNVEYGTEILEEGTDGKTISIFDSSVVSIFNGQQYTYNGTPKEISGFVDLLFIFIDHGFTSAGMVKVSGVEELVYMSSSFGPSYYFVKTYGQDGDAYTNDVYIVYNLRDYLIDTKTLLVEEGATITNNTTLSYSELDIITEIKVGESTKMFDNDSNYITATIKDMFVFEPTQVSLDTNLGYNFIGVYSAEYDADGNIIKFIELSTEDWIKGAANTAYVKKDNSIYVFYHEKQVKVTIQVNSPDNNYEKLALGITLNGEPAVDRITKLPSGDGLLITALYGQVLEILNASPMPYSIDYMIMINGGSNIKLETESLNYELVSNDGSELTEITFVLYFKIELVEVYFYTNVESPFSEGDLISGEINSITYRDALGVQNTVDAASILLTYKYCKYDGLYYNYVVEIPYGSTIIAVDVKLNNYSVTKWLLNNVEQLSLNVVANNDCHLKAEFEANDIIVEFYTSNINGEDRATKINAFTITGIKYGDKIHIKTWSRGAVLASCFRDFEVYNRNNELCAIATSKWTAIHLEKGLIRMNDDIIGKYDTEDKKVFDDFNFSKIKEPENSLLSYEYTVQRRDIDINNHMHNLYYLDLAYEALPKDVYENYSFDNVEIMYKSGAYLGDKLKCFYKEIDNEHFITIKSSDENTLHAIVKLS